MMFISLNPSGQRNGVVCLSHALTKVKYPYFLSVAGLVLVALAGLYRLIAAFAVRRILVIRPGFFPGNVTRTAPNIRALPPHMFVGYRAFPPIALVFPSFITVLGFVMIFLGLVWLGFLMFRESASPSKEPSTKS